MTPHHLNEVDEPDLGYGQLFAVFIRQKLWFFGIFSLIFALATARALLQKPIYESSLQLLIEPTYQGRREGNVQGTDQLKQQFTDTNIQLDNATQLALMQSSQLVERAVNLLRPQYPGITVDEIKKSLSVSQVVAKIDDKKTQTKIFEATYEDIDPVKTQVVLQAMQRVYQDYNLEQQEKRLERGLAFINQQLPRMRNSVNQTEQTLENFREQQNLVEPETQAKVVIEELNRVEQERRTLQAQYREAQARYRVLQQQTTSSPQQAIAASRLSESTRYQNLLNEIQKIDLELAQQRLRFTDANPLVQKLLSQRRELQTLAQQEARRTLPNPAGQIKGVEAGQLGQADVSRASQLLETQTLLSGLMARDRSLAQKEAMLRARMQRFPKILADYDRLQPELQLRRETLQQLEKARQEISLEIARGGFDWQVVEEPLLGEPTGLTPQQNILMGAVAALMLGGVATFLIDKVDQSIHDSEELKKAVHLPLLGSLPKQPKSRKKDQNHQPIIKVVTEQSPSVIPVTVQVLFEPSDWASLHLIYKNIQLQNPDVGCQTLTITSTLAEEGKSTLALGLAISAVRFNQRVLLIDAHFRAPSLHSRLNLKNERGLSTLIGNKSPILLPAPPPPGLYFDVLTSGPTPDDPIHLLSSPRIKELMSVFQENYDLVLIDVPAVLGTVDAVLVASVSQGVVLTTRLEKVKKNQLKEATHLLNQCNLIGVVANP